MDAVLSKIDALNLDDIKKKLIMPPDRGGYGWPPKETDDAIAGYRGFLKDVLRQRRRRASGRVLPDKPPAPDAVVDIVWHTHILFTEKYHRDCQEIFGEYIHHLPNLDSEAAN